MFDVKSTLKVAKSVITVNSPVLLVGASIAGVFATGVLAAKAGYKARGIVDAAEQERGEALTLQEKTSLTWLCYAAPAVTGISTIAATVGVHTIHTKRHAGLAGLYALTSTKLDDVTEKAEEMLGTKKKAQDLRDSVAQTTIDRDPLTPDREIIMTSGGDELCYDEWSGRYFNASMSHIERAFDTLNRQIIKDGNASLNELYELLELSALPMGVDYGWDSGKEVEPTFGAVKTPDGRAALSFYFHSPKKLSNAY